MPLPPPTDPGIKPIILSDGCHNHTTRSKTQRFIRDIPAEAQAVTDVRIAPTVAGRHPRKKADADGSEVDVRGGPKVLRPVYANNTGPDTMTTSDSPHSG
eukprot:9339656-Pyramimonas_sp.AAC.1